MLDIKRNGDILTLEATEEGTKQPYFVASMQWIGHKLYVDAAVAGRGASVTLAAADLGKILLFLSSTEGK